MVYIDENLIHQYNRLQWRDANKYIPLWSQKLKWGDMTDETVMDIGCGPGHNSTRVLLSTFPKVNRIVAVDGSEDMIRIAKRDNSHPKVEYHVVEVQDEKIVQKWRAFGSKIVSIHCLHWVKDQTRAFRNIYHLLKPGGEAALLFVLTGYHFEACVDMKDHPKWREITKDLPVAIPISQQENLKENYYKGVLTSIGFEVVSCETEPIIFTFPSDEECKGFMGSICSLLKFIPESQKKEFMDDLFERFLVRCGRSPQGLPELRCTYISIIMKKPQGSSKT